MRPIPTISQVFSLYRAHLREIRKLPHIYLQQFYRVKTRSDVRSMLRPSGARHLPTRFQRASQGLRRLQEANSGNVKVFQNLLGAAFGRTGAFKWELLKPLLTDPNAPPPPPIIPSKPRSRPPLYPKPLQSLLTTSHGMATRPLKKDAWTKAKLLPARADPFSDDAHIFGPFSKRREYNKQKRFFKQEIKKVLPPLEISMSTTMDASRTGNGESTEVGQRPYHADALPMQDLGLVSEIETLVGRAALAPLTRKERKAKEAIVVATASILPASTRHPSRWVRRRYRDLLAKLPIMTYRSPTPATKQHSEGTYSVQLSEYSFGRTPASDVTVREIDDTNLAWLLGGMEGKIHKAKKNG